MKSRRLPALNVQGAPTSFGQRIGDQRAMTPRYERLGAHDRGYPLSRPGLKVPQPALKVLRLHMVGESAEGRVDPAIVWRPLARMSQPAEPWHVLVSNAGSVQAAAQRYLIVLRVVAGAWDRPHVHHLLDPVRLE